MLLISTIGCTSKKSKSDIEIVFANDTLNIGYTYWWPESGPFIGNCGDELSLVFMGTITAMESPTDDPGPLYTSQRGTIEIAKVFKIKKLSENTYANQKFIATDCFHESGLNIGDKVLVICYDYEGAYSIPGGKSVLKIESFEDPLINSLRRYIDADENPVAIKNDLRLWAAQGMARALESIIDCRREINSEKNINKDLTN